MITVFWPTWRTTMIRCSACHDGTMVPGHVDNHDVGPLLGPDTVILTRAPALVCDHCGHVMLEGDVVEGARRSLARLLVERCVELRPQEARFLRETMNMTQAELAERLHVIRGTITRWENGDELLGPIQSFALRTLAAWALQDGEKLAREIAGPSAAAPMARPSPPYRIDALAA
jgi:YgiT-type zinc finger domain-containing protein